MTKKQLVIIDYDSGNLHSVRRAFEQCSGDIQITISKELNVIEQADAIVFPGQGAGAVCMKSINAIKGLDKVIAKSIAEKPFLGICMGMQVLLTKSEENEGVDCLNLVEGEVKPFPKVMGLKIPHMGWNTIKQKPHPLWYHIEDNSYFYFVHSYFCNFQNEDCVVGSTYYGVNFTSVIANIEKNKNYFAIQAHPEKSGEVGLQLIKNFVQTVT